MGIFSRFIFTIALKNKTASEKIRGLNQFSIKGGHHSYLRSDKGREFKTRFLAAYLKERRIHQIFTENETKSNFAEKKYSEPTK